MNFKKEFSSHPTTGQHH